MFSGLAETKRMHKCSFVKVFALVCNLSTVVSRVISRARACLVCYGYGFAPAFTSESGEHSMEKKLLLKEVRERKGKARRKGTCNDYVTCNICKSIIQEEKKPFKSCV